VIQAVGGGGFMPNATRIISDEFPESRQRYIGFLTTVNPLGHVLGPNIGGLLVESFGWRSVFWFNVPLGILALVLARVLIEPGAEPCNQF